MGGVFQPSIAKQNMGGVISMIAIGFKSCESICQRLGLFYAYALWMVYQSTDIRSVIYNNLNPVLHLQNQPLMGSKPGP